MATRATVRLTATKQPSGVSGRLACFAGTNQPISTASEAFRAGFLAALDNEHCEGWGTVHGINEGSLTDALYTIAHILPQDNYEQWELSWLAGMIAGSFARANNSRDDHDHDDRNSVRLEELSSESIRDGHRG